MINSVDVNRQSYSYGIVRGSQPRINNDNKF